MRIGVISDTHGGLKGWERAMEGPFHGVELILHAGDILYHGPRNPFPEGYDPQTLAWAINHSPVPLLIAKGNCDASIDQLLIDFPIQSPYVYCLIDGIAIMMTHGEDQEPEDLLELGSRYQINLLITGHTHRSHLIHRPPLLLLNPGSPSLPKGDEPPSVALVDTKSRRVSILSLDGQTLKEGELSP